MKRSALLFVAIAALAISVAAVTAGQGYEKCTAGTQECLDKMAAHFEKSGWLGVRLEHNDDGGLTVTEVVADSPAKEAGIKESDVLVAMNGIRYAEENMKAMEKNKQSQHPGSQVQYTIERNGKEKVITATLAKVPQEVLAQWIGTHMLEHAQVEVAQN